MGPACEVNPPDEPRRRREVFLCMGGKHRGEVWTTACREASCGGCAAARSRILCDLISEVEMSMGAMAPKSVSACAA